MWDMDKQITLLHIDMRQKICWSQNLASRLQSRPPFSLSEECMYVAMYVCKLIIMIPCLERNRKVS